ncbi:GNAT family N-acetyltransferase [Lichenifustis flavocetrariae]|uniref:GNAT family N-acetyltransferase n=1 Tax=Lichenifustis flavocetrariae TaxID=2949735 RepID=A0AA42CKK6_9HYPH|nr:GNAT family N-acetyltransferase [Lichenifustis flavocetrariae]MCW6510654.1 GNAT family N-acetyltransferase [Lichenifustis flavocetrariae]
MTSDQAPPSVTIRTAHPEDAAAVAALHAESWRRHYRGSLSDAYLDGPIEAERKAVWTQRLDHPRADQVVLLAVAADVLAGFVCLFLDHETLHASLIDNLHVDVEWQRRGLGRRLLKEAGDVMLHALPRRPATLYVLEANAAARRFYDRIGGVVVEQGRKTEPDGSEVAVLRYAWPTPSALIEGTSAA